MEQRQQRHEWREDTDDGIRLYRAIYHSKEWRFTTGMKGTRRFPTEWETIDEPKAEHWELLRETLFKKYQRKRCPWKMITDIDKKLGKEPQERINKDRS